MVITATRPKVGGTFVVGWYKNATVYRYKQDFDKKDKDNRYGFRFVTSQNQAILLPPDQRIFRIPRATGKKPVNGGMGQSNIWYAQELNNPEFFNDLKNLMDAGQPSKLPKKKGHTKPDVERNKLVENIAVDLIKVHFEGYGYTVKSVEKENRGWDIEASAENLTLRIEVKGLSGKILNVELTPNEYAAMLSKENQFTYRLCVVTECLDSPKMHIFSYNIASGSWMNENDELLCITERTGASIQLVN